MSLYARIQSEGLSLPQQQSIFRREMMAYRHALDHEKVRWEASTDLSDLADTASGQRIFRELWGHIAADGFPKAPIDDAYIRRHLPELEPIERQGLAMALEGLPAFRSNLEAEVGQALAAEGLAVTPTSVMMAMRLIAAGRAQAAHDSLTGFPTALHMPDATLQATPASAAVPIAAAPQPAVITPAPVVTGLVIPPEWANRTAHDIAELMIETNPKLFEHRASGKRATMQTGEQTKRQLRWAAILLDKVMYPRPFWQRTRDDAVALDKWFEQLPTSTGKSPSHRLPSCTLEMIQADAMERLDNGELDAGDIGFTIANTNKHYRFLAQIDRFTLKAIPNLCSVAFTEFCTPDLKDEREARQRISIEQATAIFALPPWTGCAGLNDRLSAGVAIFHDGLFWVLLLVWYTGARREEICKLMIVDVDCLDGIWFLRIRTTETGRVKNSSAVRIIAISEELMRLGFVEFVAAMKAAGETLLFPDLMPSTGTKRKLGDVFYKLWWIYIAPMVEPKLGRGQAMHSCRHAVSDELKKAEIFLEARNDLLGHKGKGGEGETRYPSPTALRKLKHVVDQIPVVTKALASVSKAGITLLPSALRVARPSRARRG